MRLLLDTHAFLWLIDESNKLSRAAREACEDEQNELFLSVATVWELQIKHQLGKLRLKRALDSVVEQQLELGNVKMLPIELAHIYALADLARHHRDPFDRMLIAQARVEGAELVTHDRLFKSYPVRSCGERSPHQRARPRRRKTASGGYDLVARLASGFEARQRENRTGETITLTTERCPGEEPVRLRSQ